MTLHSSLGNISSISVVIPAYNVENYITEAVESVLAQTLAPKEIVIINDGSTDLTSEKLALFSEHPLVKIINTRNRGLGPARNLGRELASGKYIYFFDSDDRLTPDFIESIERYITHNEEPDLMFFSGESFFDGGFKQKYIALDYSRKIQGLFTREKSALRALIESNSFFASACLYVSKKTLWERNHLKFEPILHEDEQVIFPLISLATSVLVIRDVFFYRRIRSGSIMTSGRSVRNAEGHLIVLKSLLDFYRSNPSLISNDNDLWIERVKTFLTSFLLMAREFDLAVDSRLVLRVAIFINQPIFYIRLLHLMLPHRYVLIVKFLLGRSTSEECRVSTEK